MVPQLICLIQQLQPLTRSLNCHMCYIQSDLLNSVRKFKPCTYIPWTVSCSGWFSRQPMFHVLGSLITLEDYNHINIQYFILKKFLKWWVSE